MSGINIPPNEQSIWNIVQAILQLAQGRSNAVGQVTLRANQSTTTVTKATSPAAVNMNENSAVFLSPKTANAQAIAYSWFISAKAQGSFVVTHANTPNAGQTFDFEIRGGA